MVIFGAAGDLTQRKLIPALYNLAKSQVLSREFAIVGVARAPMSTEDFRKKLSAGHQAIRHRTGRSRPVGMVRPPPVLPLRRLRRQERLPKVEGSARQGRQRPLHPRQSLLLPGDRRRITSGPSSSNSPPTGLMEENQHWRTSHRRKAFRPRSRIRQGAQPATAAESPTKSQIYRIDHYLGKETVQNILAFRFANGIFEPIWNRRYIDHVQISVAETVGVESRGSYYDQAGALRDMVPNHIMQLISLTAMEPPVSFHADAVRDEQAKISACHPAAQRRRSAQQNRARPVRRGHRQRRARARISRRAGRASRLQDRNLRRHEAANRQLALGRRSLLSAHRKASRGAQHAHRHPVPARAVRAVPRHAGREPDAQSTGPAHSAGRRHFACASPPRFPDPAMRLGAVDMNFEYADYFGTQPSTGYERLLHDCMIGDRDAVPARRHGRSRMVRGQSGCSTSGKRCRRATSPTMPPAPGGRKRPTNLLERDGRHWRNFEK